MTDSAQIKGVLLAEMDSLAKDLANGGGADLVKQGQALSYILRIMRPLVERESVQEAECRERMMIIGKRLEDHYAKCPAAKLLEKPLEGGGVILAKAASQSLPWMVAITLLGLWLFLK
jgi:hypothetical protein